MTRLVVSIPAGDALQAERDVGAARAAGARAIELRLDDYHGDVGAINALVRRCGDVEWILACRPPRDGGGFEGTPRERLALLAGAAKGTGAWVDIEFDEWRRAATRGGWMEAVFGEGRPERLVLSTHRFDPSCPDVAAIASRGLDGGGIRLARFSDSGSAALCDTSEGGGPRGLNPAARDADGNTNRDADEDANRDADWDADGDADGDAARDVELGNTLVKIAWVPADIRGNFDAFEAMRAGGGRVIAVCMGEQGIPSRVLAPKFGAAATFCAWDAARATAPGQMTFARMMTTYRWDHIDPRTRVLGVIGDPVRHSLGPILFNRLFDHHRINAVYLPLRVRGRRELAGLLRGLADRPWIDARGFSVTLPHKVAAFELADACPDEWTRRAGAVNTLTWGGGRWVGTNTDAHAAVASLADALKRAPDDWTGLRVTLLGTGGVARALAAGLGAHDCALTVYGRSPDATAAFAARFGCQRAAWEDRGGASGDVLINATSVGLWPDIDATPVAPAVSARHGLVFDVIYRPMQTRLLREAARAGCRTLGGLDMFLRQAAMQFESWTGVSPDAAVMRSCVEGELGSLAGDVHP